MVAETTSFFREMLETHPGLHDYLTPDWTMLNGPLARLSAYRAWGRSADTQT